MLPDSTGTGAIWAALRVPDDSAAAVMNSFTIRALPLDDNATALYSTTLITEAEALGWDGSAGTNPLGDGSTLGLLDLLTNAKAPRIAFPAGIGCGLARGVWLRARW